ncbi:MAG: hypothetical protein LQ350_003895 [Teloschistes chrysophthalmus]|nr:MAG: hypothetical protein LQ350_003895 [Niorma chrysophthalma]
MGKRNTFVVMQSEDVTPKYRDDPPPDYYIQPAWHQWWLSSILGAPEIVIPAGSITYRSRISELDEQLPVTAQILGAPRSDLKLISTAQRFLKDVGRPTTVKTGRNMFT